MRYGACQLTSAGSITPTLSPIITPITATPTSVGVVFNNVPHVFVSSIDNGGVVPVGICSDMQNNYGYLLGAGGYIERHDGNDTSTYAHIPQLTGLSGCVVDPNTGDVYVANGTAVYLVPAGTNLTLYSLELYAGSPNASGYTDGSRLSSRFSVLGQMAVYGSSLLYVADTTNKYIRVINMSSDAVTTFTYNGSPFHFSYVPVGLVVRDDGMVYVSFPSMNQISRFNANGAMYPSIYCGGK